MAQILLSAHRLEKSFASRTLFQGLTFAIEEGNRIGLIGPNGAGKSTLMKILAGRIARDGGDLSVGRGVTIGMLEQTPSFESEDQTIYEVVASGVEDPYDPDHMARVDATLSRLNFAQGEVSPDQAIGALSGGWRKRVALARELAKNPDLLLLDEPTNHLDVEGIEWLEGFLANSKLATVTVTHDRLFLQRVANRIFDLDPRYKDGMLVVNDEYLAYLDARDTLLRGQEQRELVLKNTLRRETEWLRRGAKARTTKQTARIKRAGDLNEEVSDLENRNMKRTLRIDFQESDRNPQKLIEAKEISKSFISPEGDTKTLFHDLSLILTPKTRLGLLGANGSGKSTLIRCLLGLEQPDSGQVKRAEKIEVAYFEQHRDTLDFKKTVLRNVCDEGDYVDFRGQFVYARSYLDRFLFRTEQHDMPVEKLSGGEQARLRVAQMMLRPANILVLDEPTNDLDLATMAVLEDVLLDFKGAVILVSHDRYFLDQVSNRLLAFDRDVDGDPLMIEFADFSQWEDWWINHQQEKKNHAKALGKNKSSANTKNSAPASSVAVDSSVAKKRKLSHKEQRELDGMETTIHQAEEKLASLQVQTELQENLTDANKLTELYAGIAAEQSRIEKLYARWSELTAEPT